MENGNKKRGRFEPIREEWRSPSMYDETEACNPAKRIYEDSNCRNVDVFFEIICKKNTQNVDCSHEKIDECSVWDMMKTLEEEIMWRPSCRNEANINGSNERYGVGLHGEEESVNSGDSEDSGVECNSYNAELDYLLRASDNELGIPTIPEQSCFVEAVKDYSHEYGFLECLQIEREPEQQLPLRNWCNNKKSKEQDRC